MPIIELQRRMRQLGEIRIGRVVDTGKISQKTGRPIMRPEKLDRFRLTSASKPLLEEVAALYGGQVQPWTPANGGPSEWEVFTDADRLPVLVPPREPVTQWYEQFKGSKCVRRCDGITEQKSDTPCMCNPDKRACQITTRLNVMLRDVPGLGVWLLTSHGFYAAVELPEVAQFLASTRGYVDAWLAMEEKQVVRDDGTARFMVPKLDVAVTPAQLLAGEGAIAPAAVSAGQRQAVGGNGPAAVTAPLPRAVAGNEQPAIEPPTAATAPTAEDFLIRARKVHTFDEFKTIWDEAAAAGISPSKAQSDEMTRIGKDLKASVDTPPPPAETGQPAAVSDVDVLWQAIVARWPRGMTELQKVFKGAMGTEHNIATENELAAFLKIVDEGRYDAQVTAAAAAGGLEEPVPF